ncbi:hypothetical protein C8R45DRAFT_932275 [Mycena sanguinolenta]|nr:hypothetical protein C8R45DRAFT_932275 [Mycena sanguinolenta]
MFNLAGRWSVLAFHVIVTSRDRMEGSDGSPWGTPNGQAELWIQLVVPRFSARETPAMMPTAALHPLFLSPLTSSIRVRDSGTRVVVVRLRACHMSAVIRPTARAHSVVLLARVPFVPARHLRYVFNLGSSLHNLRAFASALHSPAPLTPYRARTSTSQPCATIQPPSGSAYLVLLHPQCSLLATAFFYGLSHQILQVSVHNDHKSDAVCGASPDYLRSTKADLPLPFRVAFTQSFPRRLLLGQRLE